MIILIIPNPAKVYIGFLGAYERLYAFTESKKVYKVVRKYAAKANPNPNKINLSFKS